MALRLPRQTTLDERHAAWMRVIKRAADEQTKQGWRHRTFRLLRAVFNSNAQLSADGGFVFNWMAENYLDSALMVVRRELDVQAGTENLRNLLEDIVEHPDVLTRARYLAQWPADEHELADHAFDSFNPTKIAGAPNRDHINPLNVRSDLDKLEADAERLRIYAERTRAHRTPVQGIDNTTTFADLHKAIEDTREVVGKYHALLTLGSIVDWEPQPMYDTFAPFKSAWITDDAAVARKLDE